MLIIGCDLHTRYQQMAMVDTATGELTEKRLEHENGEAKQFYEGLPVTGAGGHREHGLDHVVCRDVERAGPRVGGGRRGQDSEDGNPQAEARSPGCSPHLASAVAGRFSAPLAAQRGGAGRAGVAGASSRYQLVQLRTRAKNGLQAMALSYGVRRRSKLWNEAGRAALEGLPLRSGMARRREDLLRLLSQLDVWIAELDQRIDQEVARPRRPSAC